MQMHHYPFGRIGAPSLAETYAGWLNNFHLQSGVAPRVEDIEREIAKHHGFARHDEHRIRERWAIRRACQKRFGVKAIEARTHSYAIKSHIRQLREDRRIVAALTAEVTRIEETRPASPLALSVAHAALAAE